MNKLLALLALATITSSAFGQISLPGTGRRDRPDAVDISRSEREFEILPVQQIIPACAVDIGKGGIVALPEGA